LFSKKQHFSQPIIGECVNALGVGYHPEHFCCEICKTTLEVQFVLFLFVFLKIYILKNKGGFFRA
jgi:hypothetical protein